MLIEDPIELKIIEKYREILDKVARAGDPEISRTFSFPSTIDSDEQINISVGVRLSSVVPIMSEMETKVERTKLKLRVDLPASSVERDADNIGKERP